MARQALQDILRLFKQWSQSGTGRSGRVQYDDVSEVSPGLHAFGVTFFSPGRVSTFQHRQVGKILDEFEVRRIAGAAGSLRYRRVYGSDSVLLTVSASRSFTARSLRREVVRHFPG